MRKLRNSLVLLSLDAAAAEERGIPKSIGPQFRAMDRTGYDQDGHTVSMALSSDQPVERGYGTEILSHAPGAIRTGRLKQGIPLLFNHDMDQHLGVSTGFEISGGTLRTTSRFGGNPLALEKEGDVRSGILKDVSVAYMVYEWEIVEDTKGNRTYTATDWEPFEGSLVTVPADSKGSGVGRNLGEGEVPVKITFRKLEDDEDDPEEEDADEDDPEEGDADEDDPDNGSTPARSTNPTETRSIMPEPIVAGPDLAALEQTRVTELRTLHTQYPTEFNERSLNAAITLGLDPAKAKERVADAVIAAAQRNDIPTAADEVFGAMTAKDLSRYSPAGAYRAAANQFRAGTFPGKELEGGFEREVGEDLRKAAEKRGVTTLGAGIPIPSSTTLAVHRSLQQRTVAAGGNAGTATNFTTVVADPIELLRYRTVLLALGARMLPGLHGAVQMPKQTGAATSNWVNEGAAATETDPTLGFFTMKPNRLTMQNAYFRDFLAQSGLAIDGFLSDDRMAVLARSLDTAGLVGTGVAPVPLGLLNQTGLAGVLAGSTRAANGTVTAGAGGVPLTFVDYNNLEAAIATANADIGTMGILTTPKVRASGRSTPQIPGTASGFVWPNSKVDANTGIQEGPLGYNAMVTSNPVLTGFTANSVSGLHAVIMGVFNQILFGDWGLSELIVDPYTGAGTARMLFTENAYYDINVRHVESFAACTSALPS